MSIAVNGTGNEPNSCAIPVPSAKRDARAFARWYLEANRGWPLELKRLGTFAMLALQLLDQPRQPSPSEVRIAREDLTNFRAAYAAHMAGVVWGTPA